MRQLSLFEKENEGHTYSQICEAIGCRENVPAWPDDFGRRIKKYLQESGIPEIRTLSLFSGAGGLDIGFSDVGFNIVESVEIEEKFCDTLRLNSGHDKQFENAKVQCMDIREYSGSSLGKIDFIIGGPPCQTFSAAGRRANGVLGTTDARGVLFKEYVRLLQELSPAGFLFENVYGIVGAQGGKPWQEILSSFSDVGYKLFYGILDAADYGVPQHRERLLIVGLKDGVFKFPRPTHGPDSLDGQPFYNAETALAGLELSAEESQSGIGGRYGALLNDIPPGLNYSFYTEEMGHPNPIFAWRSKFSDFLYKADPNQPVRTIKASGGAYTGPFHWENRFFAYAEYKRLQTFPDEYEISGSKQTAVKQIGNSVPPQLARMMAIAIRQQVFNTSFPFKLALLEDGGELTFRKRKRELTAVYKHKAGLAIASMKNNKTVFPDSRSYYCSMDGSFDYRETKEENAQYKVVVTWSEALDIQIHDSRTSGFLDVPIAVIDIDANNLNMGIRTIKLRVFSQNELAYTVAWKALEHELIINAIKADLVQLNGYYQYEPKIKGTCHFYCGYPYAHAIEKIVSGETVANIVSAHDMAEALTIREQDLLGMAKFLRKIGYEIRNHNTNPQIEAGWWLIPYSFPTLTRQSVQLRKRL